MSDLRELRDSIVAGVRRFGAFRKRWVLLEGAARFVVGFVGALLAWFLLDWAVKLPMWPLVLLFAAILVAGVVLLIRHVLLPSLRRIETEREALLLEKLHGRLDNQIIGALQLGAEVADAETKAGTLGYSTNLVRELVQRTARTVGELEPAKLLDLRLAKKLLGGAGALVLVVLLLCVAAPGVVQQRIERLRDAYAGVLDTLFPVELRVEPGDVAVLRGSPVKLSVQVIGARRRQVELVRVDDKTKAVATETLALTAQAARFEVAAAEKSFSYQFRYGNRVSKPHRVRVGDRPELSAMHYELAYPAYTGVPARTIVGFVPRLQALSATAVQVSLAVDKAELHPTLSHVRWQDGSRQPLNVSGRFATFSFSIDRPERATIFLASTLGAGFEMKEPVSFEVLVDRDQAPKVEILLRNRNLTMFADAAGGFGLNYVAEDDFGVAEVALEYRIDTVDALLGRSPRNGTVARLIEPARDRVKGNFADIFKSLSPPLEPGDRITLTVTAKDNNTESGPSLGRSAPVQIVIVRPDLAGFQEQQFGFGAESALGGLKKVKRATNLLVDPEKSIRKEAALKVDRQELKARAGQESFPSGAEESIGDYFRLLSGEK